MVRFKLGNDITGEKYLFGRAGKEGILGTLGKRAGNIGICLERMYRLGRMKYMAGIDMEMLEEEGGEKR